MAVKKMVSNEPKWLFIRKKEISKKKTTDTVTPYVVNTDRPEVRFVFNGTAVVAKYTLERGIK